MEILKLLGLTIFLSHFSHALLQVSKKELSIDDELVLLLVKVIKFLLLIFLLLSQPFMLFMLS